MKTEIFNRTVKIGTKTLDQIMGKYYQIKRKHGTAILKIDSMNHKNSIFMFKVLG